MRGDGKHMEEPTRLSAEGGTLSSLATLGEQGLSVQRLVDNGASLEARLGAGVGGAAATTSLLSKFGLVSVLCAGIGGGIWLGRDASSSIRTQPIVTSGPVVATLPTPATPTPATLPEPIARTPVVELPTKLLPPPANLRTEKKSEDARQPVPPPAPASELPTQLAMLEEANQNIKSGKHREALSLLERLTTRFPRTPLRLETELSRAEALSLSGQHNAAIPLIRRLLRDPSHRGRHAELWHMLGDLQLRQNDCASALSSFGKALALGLGNRRKHAAESGLARCHATEATEKEMEKE